MQGVLLPQTRGLEGQETSCFCGSIQQSLWGWGACHSCPPPQGQVWEAWTRSARASTNSPPNSLLLPHFGVGVGARVAHAGRRAGSGVTESGVSMPRAPAGASSPVAFCPISVWGRPEGKVGRRSREGDGLPALLAQFLPSLSKGELRIRPGRVGEGLGGGGGEGDFSPAAAAFQRDSARPRGREQGWRRGKEHSPSGP